MRILLVGQSQAWSLECHYQKYLAPHADVFTYASGDIFDEYYHSSIFNKLKFKLGISKIYDEITKGLLAKVDEVKPDIVWVFKGMRIVPKVLQQIKEKGIHLANYNPDHPFFFSGTGSGNANVTASIGLYDLHFCYDPRVAEKIEKDFGICTAILPFAYELADELYHEIKSQKEINSACFIGTCDDIRVAHVLELAKAGILVHTYGNNWAEMVPKDEKNIVLHPAVYNQEFWETMYKYRLQLNIFRPHNIGSHNMRTFEVPAVGSIMLAPDSPGHHEYFESEKEIFLYRSKEEMVEKARQILSLSEEEASQVRKNARNRSVVSQYTYQSRAMDALNSFKQLVKKA